MPHFIVNRNSQANGDHEVHELDTGCIFLPNIENQVGLGWQIDCHSAVREAKLLHYPRSNGCFWCARPCHTT